MTESTLDTLTRRLDRLERENRRLKRWGSLALIGLVSLIFMGQIASSAPKVVEGKSFILRDTKGRLRAKLGMSRERLAGLVLLDEAGTPSASLSTASDGKSTLELLDKAGHERAMLFKDAEGTSGLSLRDETGNPRVMLAITLGMATFSLHAGSGNTARVHIAANSTAASFRLLDKSETTRATFGISDQGVVVLQAFDKDDRVIWKVP